jgi:hypothetical protein
VIGQISGIDGPARSLDRLATSAERAAALVERLEAEVTVEYVLETLERLHRLADVIEEMNRSVRAMEVAIVDLHTRVAQPLDQFPLRGLRRRRKAATPDA